MSYDTVIGLEIHLKLNSSCKLFCSCANVQEFENLMPNTHICPVCTGQPGALPVLQEEALEKALLLGLALQCHIQELSSFDRKSYFYPDLPMGYQITQQRNPTCINGQVNFRVDKEFTVSKSVRIRDAHIETDTGKTNQVEGGIAIDWNRAGTPLVEIVTHPDFSSADEVVAFLKELQKIARIHDISHAELESGQMRCDVNISLRPAGKERLGTRVELKNMNSYSAIQEAIQHEILRQTDILDEGLSIDQETRGRNDTGKISYVMRSKEDAMDYRFMPEQDLPQLDLDLHWIDMLRTKLKPLPAESIGHYRDAYGFNKEFINGLLVDSSMQEYFERCVADGYDPKLVATWLVGPIARWCNENQKTVDMLPFGRENFLHFLTLQKQGKLTMQTAKAVISEMIQHGVDSEKAMDMLGIQEVTDEQIKAWVQQVFVEKPDLLEDLKTGNMKPLGFVTGQVMKRSGGSADPQKVQTILQQMIR